MTLYELGRLQYINIALVPTAIYTILKYHKYRHNVCENCCIDPSREANKSLMRYNSRLSDIIQYNNATMSEYCEMLDKSQDGLKHENERLRKRLKERHIVLIPKRCMEEMND